MLMAFKKFDVPFSKKRPGVRELGRLFVFLTWQIHATLIQ
jgi:hypothetical protein